MAPRLVRRRRLWLASAVAVLVALAGGLQGTKAAFTTSETFEWDASSGSLALTRDGDGLLFDSSPLAPGDAATGVVRLKNTGTIEAEIALTRESVSSTAPAGCEVRDALHVQVVEDRDGDPLTSDDRTDVADDALTEIGDALALSSFAAGEARTYEVTVTFTPQHGATADDNDNCFQGSVATERFGWQAVEARP